MAEMRGAARYVQKQEWAKDNRARAKELLRDAEVLQNQLFDSGDLTPYLNMVSRLRYQNSRNLLLLMDRFPSATCLTGFRIWQRRLPDPMAPVLRTSQKGKGIELLVPFTDIASNSMTWYAAMHFDVSQVNFSYTPPTGPYDPKYPGHLRALLTAIHSVLSEHYSMTIQSAEDAEAIDMLNVINSEGIMFSDHLLIRSDIASEEKVRWLSASLCRLYLQHNHAPQIYENYLSLCAAHCLFNRWGTEELSQLSPNPALVMSVSEDERQLCLDLIQRCVHTVESQISSHYEAARSLDAEVSAEFRI